MSAVIENNKLVLTNPITNQNIGEIDICSQSLFSKIEENATTYHDWRKLSLNGRCKLINKFRKSILSNKNKILEPIIFKLSLIEHFLKWKPYINKFGLIILELHTINPDVCSKNIGNTVATAYDATHGYSNQYIIISRVY